VARPLRIQFDGAWYHVMNRGACRRNIFRDTSDRLVFLHLLAEISDRTSVEIHAYCLMGNHFHLLVRTPKANIAEFMRLLSSKYARYFNDKYGRDGGVCRGRYKGILIDSERYLLAVSRYIHRNPLIFGPDSLVDYVWSSYPAFLDVRPPQEWLTLDETLRLGGGSRLYEALVESPLPSEVDEIYRRSQLPSILGSREFKDRARAESDISEDRV
jgi:putative transposase